MVEKCKKKGQNQDSKTNVSICSHWTTIARKTEDKMVGDCSRPPGLIMEWNMMI
jgi:hypothetical protein